MNKYYPMILIVFILFSSTMAQENLKKEGRYYVADIDKEFTVEKSGDLVMENINGDVTVTVWDKNSVKIHEIRKMDVYTQNEAEAILKDASSTYSQQGNTIRVGSRDHFRSHTESIFDISVPGEFNVDINTSGGDISITEVKGTAVLKTSGGDIELLRVDGKVDASTSGGDVRVVQNTNAVTLRTSGGDIDVIDVAGEVVAKTSGGDVSVRNNKAHVDVKTSGGDIRLENVGAEIEASTSGGDIVVDSSAGSIDVSTSGGDIDLRNINGVARGHTSGGDIQATHVLNGVEVKTSGGDIILKDIQGFIDGATSGGDIEAEMTLKDFTKDHRVDLKSSGGNLTLWIPDKLPATVRAEVKITESSWGKGFRDYNIESEFQLTKETNDKGNGGNYILVQGKLNGGGDLINLQTTNGSIYIKKLK